jgi:hypothetical protein
LSAARLCVTETCHLRQTYSLGLAAHLSGKPEDLPLPANEPAGRLKHRRRQGKEQLAKKALSLLPAARVQKTYDATVSRE